jgi:valyl-tRNA synthetase
VAEQKLVDQLEGRLSNSSYVENAPKAIVEQTRHQLAETKAQLEKLQTEHKRFAS